jgi:hypothetical protein
MDAKPDNTPPGWAEILDESLAEIDAGLFVDGDEIMRELRESAARLEAKQAHPQRDEALPLR